MDICEHIKAKGKPEWTTLYKHLKDVAFIAEIVAQNTGLDKEIVRVGAILHDIGKASTVFQQRLKSNTKPETPFRHEIVSCFFLSLFDEKIQPFLIEMIIGHHKSVLHDSKDKGILDLEEIGYDVFGLHIKDWDFWSSDALKILSSFEINTHQITKAEALKNYNKVLNYCEKTVQEKGFSDWRGILIASDHFASALSEKTETIANRIFKTPNLNFFNRTHELYPLSLISAISEKKHTIVVASTGAGKTDFLFRRCNGRVFYTLPFQASINAMFHRVSKDLKKDNPEIDIRLQHSASEIVLGNKAPEEKVLQTHIGSAIKILTPHQIAAIVFATSGFEAVITDIKGCDVILDEIHTYTDVTRAIVLKIVHVLKYLNCRIHIGTATMPSVLYNKIIELLGKENVYEVKLTNDELMKFDRHIAYKLNSWQESKNIIQKAIYENKKILIVCNKVKTAQEQFKIIQDLYPEIPNLLLHSRFKRKDREQKEKELIGLDENGNSLNRFNTSDKACIVVSTQVVEVSIDISFDLMITECAPLDAMIQRFGRVNRKRNKETIGKYKSVYVIQPPEEIKNALPYNLEILKRSFEVIENGEILHENELQQKIDKVFPQIDFMNIEEHSEFKETGNWNIRKLTHNPKSKLLEMLDIDSVACICEADEGNYMNANFEERMKMEIPMRYWSVNKLRQLQFGNRPFIVPDSAYSDEIGLNSDFAKTENYNVKYSFL